MRGVDKVGRVMTLHKQSGFNVFRRHLLDVSRLDVLRRLVGGLRILTMLRT